MAKGATSKSKTKNEENRKREEEQQKQQTTQKRADSKPQRTQTAETKPTTQEAAPKPTSTQIPTLEPKYASPEQIEEARNVGRRSLEMARAGQIRDESPIQYGVRGIAEQYDIPKVEETPSTTMPPNEYAPQTHQERTGKGYRPSPEEEPTYNKNAYKSGQEVPQEEAGPVDVLGSRRTNSISEEGQRQVDKLKRQIESLQNTPMTGDVAIDEVTQRNNQDEIAKLQRQIDSIYGTDNSSNESNVERYLDPNYRLSKYEEQNAEQIFDEYLENNPKAKELYNTTDAAMSSLLAQRFTPEEAEEYARMVTLKNKTSNLGSAGLHMAQSMPFVRGLADKSMEAYENQKGGGKKGEGSKGIDLSDYNYSAQLEQTQRQNPLASTAGNMGYQLGSYAAFAPLVEGIPVVGKAASALGGKFSNPAVAKAVESIVSGQAADTILDTLPNEIIPDIMEGNWRDLPKDIALNQLGNLAFNVAGEGIGALARNFIPSLRQADEVADAVKQNELDPADLARQNEVDVNAKVDDVNQAVDEINDLAEQIPEAPAQPIEQAARNVENVPTTPDDIANFEAQRQQLFDEIDDVMARSEDPSMYYGELSDLEDDMYRAHPELFDPETSSYVGLPKESVSSATPKVEAEAEPETPFSIEGTNLEWLKNDIDTLTMPKDVRADLKSKYSQYENIYRNLGKAESADEITDLLRQQEVLHEDIKKILQENAGYPAAQKGKYDDITRSFVESLNGMRINVPDHVRSELPDAKINDLNKHFSFSEIGNNGKRNYLDFKLSQRGGVPVDTVFADIDNATGHALSSFMERQGLNPDVTENQILGLIEYADYLKSDYFKNTQTLIPYDTSRFRDLARETIDRGRSQFDRIQAQSIKAADEVADAVPASTVTNNAPAMPDLPRAEEQSLDAIPNGSDLPPVNNPTKDLGFDPNDPYVPDPNAIRNNSIPTVDNPKTKNSKLGTNTMRTLDGDEANAEDLSRGLYSYVPKEEQETMRVAAKRVAESQNKAFNEILNTADDAFTAEDVDTSMMLRNKIKQDLAFAKNSGDTQTANYLQSQLDALTVRQRKAASNSGQVSQAWAKWSRDADGAVFASYNIAARQYEDALKNNPRLGEMMHESTEELWEQLSNADLSNETVESLSSKIQDMLRRIIDKNGNHRIKRNFQESNIKKLSDTLAMQMKHNEDIGETLDMIEQAGVTGFTGLDDSIEQEVRDLFDQAEMFGYKSKQRFELENQAYAKLAQALNLTGGIYDKADTIRYFAMLANPKTHLRNIVGNYTWGEITNFKDQLAGILEEAVDRASLKKGARAAERGVELKHGGQGIDRTTTFIRKNGADRNLYNAALDDFEENAFTDLVGNKYTTSAQGIEGNKNVFGYGKVGSAVSDTAKANSSVLELEDIAAKRRKYADSLTRYLKANGYDESVLKGDITDPQTLKFLEEARAHAVGEAEKATFNQENWLADRLTKFSKEAREINWSEEGAGKRAHKVAGLFLDATVPFKRTPMNIVTSLWDYQPIHLARFGVDIADIARHKPRAVNKLIDDLAKETTGVSLLAAGWGLAKSGFITGRKDEETGELDALTGKQDYSLNLGPLGSYTLDWLSPSLTILLAGANLAQSGLSAEGFTRMLADIGEPVLETTMLSSLVDVLRSAQYAEDPMDTVQQSVATAAKNYVSQFVPTELGNIARSIDNTRRSTYTDKTGVSGIIDRAKKSIINKIPGLSETSQPYINRWGEQEQNYEGPGKENIGARLAYNHLSPGYYSSDETSTKDEYLYSLYEQLPQKDPEIFPQAFSTKISEDGVQRKVTPEEKTMKDTVEGNARDAFITAMANSEEIRLLPPETQAAIAKDMYEVAKLAGNASIIDGYTSTNKGYNTYLAGQQAKGGRTGVQDLLRYEIQKYTMKNAGISTSANISDTLGEMYKTDPEQARQMTDNVATLVNAGVSPTGQNTYVTRGINFLGNIDPKQYADTWNSINGDTGDTDKITQTELKDYFTNNKITNQEDMFELWGGYLSDFDPKADSFTVPYLKDDGTIGSHTATNNEKRLMQKILNGDSSSEQEVSETQPETPARLEPIYVTPPAQEAPTTTQSTGAYNTIEDVWGAMKDSGFTTSGASPYWKQASAQGATPQQFYEYYNAIDSALGKPNGGVSMNEWAQYLNDNGLPYDKDMEIIRLMYNTRWTPLRYEDETWYSAK